MMEHSGLTGAVNMAGVSPGPQGKKLLLFYINTQGVKEGVTQVQYASGRSEEERSHSQPAWLSKFITPS